MNSGPGTNEAARQKAGETAGKAQQEAQAAGETIKREAAAVAGQAGELGREHAERRFEQGKQTVEGQVGAVGAALGDAADRLREENNPLASYADELSGQLSQLSKGIENSTLDDLAVKTRGLARDNPGLFVMGSVVAGLAAARFFKASAERERRERWESGGQAYGYDDRDGPRHATTGTETGYRSPVADPSGLGVRGSTSVPPGGARVPMDSTAKTGTAAGGTAATGTPPPATTTTGV